METGTGEDMKEAFVWNIQNLSMIKEQISDEFRFGLDEVRRNSITSMAAFIHCTDLTSHMFGFITKREDKQSATLVCKGWREFSDTFPTLRKAILNIKHENGSRLKRVGEREIDGTVVWDTSMSNIKGMLTYRKHIT